MFGCSLHQYSIIIRPGTDDRGCAERDKIRYGSDWMKVLALASGAFMMSASTNAALVLAGADRMWGGSAAAESTCDGACTYTGG
jgi:hypothetical protein